MPNYVKSILRPGSKIFVVGEAPGEDEDRMGQPFVGKAGKLLNQLLEQAGINRAEVSIANVARERPPGNKITFFFEDARCTTPKPIMSRWREELKQEIIQVKPNIVIAMGATAMWAMLGEKGMVENRGYIQQANLVPDQKMIVTWHPQKVGYEWKLAFETVMDLRKAQKNSDFPGIRPDARALNAYPSAKEFIEYLKFLLFEHKDMIAVDLETVGDVYADILGLADSPYHAVSIEMLNPNKTPKFTTQTEHEIWYLFARILQSKEIVMQNGLYDAALLMHKNHIYAKGFKYDTMIAAHCCWPEARRSLSFLSTICLDVPKWKHQSQSAPTLYNAGDAANTYGVWKVMEKEMEKLGVRHTFDFEMMQVWPAMMMQLRGLAVDKEKQKNLISSINQRLVELDSEITTAIGKKINLNSPKQMQTLLYIDMKLPIQYKRRKSRMDDRKMTANNEALRKLQRITDNPVLENIISYKKYFKLLSFIDIPVSPEGRIHCSYNITGATMARTKKGLIVDDEDSYKSFGRWSSSQSIILPYGSGNNQNIPKKARVIYTAPPDHVFLQADYIQAEAVVVAYCIGDEMLKRMFKAAFGLSREERKAKNYDVHKLTAALMFGVPITEVTEDQRTRGKRIRHSTNYSAGPAVLAADLSCPMNEAKALLDQFHASCPQLKLWHREIEKELYRTRTLTNLLGRKHRFLERWGDELFRSAYSYIPQSTVGDLLNTALVRLYNNYGTEADICLQLHDAIYVVCHKDEVEDMMERMKQSMMIPLMCNGEEFKIDVDFSVGPSWGEQEEI